MKMHSYMAVNGAMADNYHRMLKVERNLELRLAELADESKDVSAKRSKSDKTAPRVSEEAWNAAVKAAQSSREKTELASWTSLSAQQGSSELRQRVRGVQRKGSLSREARTDSTAAAEHTVHDPHPLATHPDGQVSALAREIEDVREDLRSSGPDETGAYVSWPQNVTYLNFWDYLCCPVLVYELTYPRVKT